MSTVDIVVVTCYDISVYINQYILQQDTRRYDWTLLNVTGHDPAWQDRRWLDRTYLDVKRQDKGWDGIGWGYRRWWKMEWDVIKYLNLIV